MAKLNSPLFVVSDPESPHFGKYVRKIYRTVGGLWACQTYDKSEKMFVNESKLTDQKQWERENHE